MVKEFDDVLMTAMDSGVSMSFRDGCSIYVPEHIINRSSLLRQTVQNVDTGGVVSLPILRVALASWLKCLRELSICAAQSGPSEGPCRDITDGETLVEYLKV